MKVAYQGIPGAYSHEACLNFFGKKAQALSNPLSEGVFEALKEGKADVGFLPVENSIVGNVAVNLDLILENDYFVIGEHYQKIHHHLLALPGSKLSDIKRVYSHPVALAQCRDFFKAHRLEAIADYDTAGAALELSKRKKKEEAVVAGFSCASLYGLDVLSDKIQNTAHNLTRFWSFVPSSQVPETHHKNCQKTSLAFTTKHTPGALLDCLQSFASHGLNLEKIESRPIPSDPFTYTFFVDYTGNTKSENASACLLELKGKTRSLKILGSYPKGALP